MLRVRNVGLECFERVDSVSSDAEALDRGLLALESHIHKEGHVPGITVLLTSKGELAPRARSVFMNVVLALGHRRREVVLLDSGALMSTAGRGARTLSSVLVGDLLQNRFSLLGRVGSKKASLLGDKAPARGVIALRQTVASRLRKAYLKHLGQGLGESLLADGVHHRDGPFLIEGQYYTAEFFEVSRALRDPVRVRRFGEWCALVTADCEPEVLVLTTEVLEPLAIAFREAARRLSGKDLAIIYHDRARGPADFLKKTLGQSGARGVVLTDVVCRGETIRGTLNSTAGIRMTALVALVDARESPHRGQPIAYRDARRPSYVQVFSVLEHGIAVHRDPPPSERARTDEMEHDKCYVIDSRTHAPTLYVRHLSSKVGIEELILDKAYTTGALLAGHSEFLGRHYAYFLSFPELFPGLRDEIADWIREQVSYVQETKAKEPLRFIVYDPDGSLTWLSSFLWEIEHVGRIDFVTMDEAGAPSPPVNESVCGSVFIILPAVASGKTVQQLVEFASRARPRDIVVLVVVSRGEAAQMAFLDGVSKYREATIRFVHFAQYRLPAYGKDASSCPLCRGVAELERMRDAIEARFGKEHALAMRVDEELAGRRAVELGGSVGDSLSAEVEAYRKAYLRVLYEVALLELPERRRLNRILCEEQGYLDEFLEVLSHEWRAEAFGREKREQVLYKALDVLRARALEIVRSSVPPFPLSRVVNALVLLAPGALLGQSADLMRRYVSSNEDIAALCLSLWGMRLQPAGVDGLMGWLREGGWESAEAMVAATLQLVAEGASYDGQRIPGEVAAVEKLWSMLVRSSQFAKTIESLALGGSAYLSPSEVAEKVEAVLRDWRVSVAPVVYGLENGVLWHVLSQDVASLGGRGEASLAGNVSNLEHFVAQLKAALVSLREVGDPACVDGATRIARSIHAVNARIAEQLWSGFCSPTACAVYEMGDCLTTNAGEDLRVERDLDYATPWVFCPKSTVDYYCAQICDNWQRYIERPAEDVVLRVAVKCDGAFVGFTFADNAEGDFSLESDGGLSYIRQSVARYGGALALHARDADGFKAVEIKLRAGEPGGRVGQRAAAPGGVVNEDSAG
jgi:hypothetical protein